VPFGLSPRCPAGALSLVIAHEVLCRLLARYKWRLARPQRNAAWVVRLVGAPTLVVPGPLPLMFDGLPVDRGRDCLL
jgi:hypothetical protein